MEDCCPRRAVFVPKIDSCSTEGGYNTTVCLFTLFHNVYKPVNITGRHDFINKSLLFYSCRLSLLLFIWQCFLSMTMMRQFINQNARFTILLHMLLAKHITVLFTLQQNGPRYKFTVCNVLFYHLQGTPFTNLINVLQPVSGYYNIRSLNPIPLLIPHHFTFEETLKPDESQFLRLPFRTSFVFVFLTEITCFLSK